MSAGRRRADVQPAIVLDPGSSLSLQHQIRQKLIEAMSRGVLQPGRRLPSSRWLARQLGVARNTVTLAYDALLSAGHLVSRPRSGIFVPTEVQGERVTTGRRGLARNARPNPASPVATPVSTDFRPPPNWQQHPYPFLDGCIDSSLAPVEEWREALRIAFGKRDLLRWSSASPEHDDARLSEQVRINLLPLWGLDAAPDEILSAISARHALHLVMEATVTRNTAVYVDSSVDSDTRRCLIDRQITPLPFDLHGPQSEALETLPPRAVVFIGDQQASGANPLTRSRAAAFLAAAEHSDATVIECVSTPDVRESRKSIPSLRALDLTGRTILIAALSPIGSIGTPPAFINGDPSLIERIRETRRVIGSELQAGLQRAWSYFIGLGHYAAAMTRAGPILSERRIALRDALNHYLHKFVSIHSRAGSSAYWVHGGPNLNAEALARTAATMGILIQPVAYPDRSDIFAMGVTSLPKQRIREGVERLARLIRRDPKLGSRELRDETTAPLTGKALQRSISNTTLLYNTVYGEPCTIQVLADGTLVGRAGYANEDCDNGRWWVEDDKWFRQWQSWAYGEALGLHTVIDGDQVRWFNTEGILVDTAVIARERA